METVIVQPPAGNGPADLIRLRPGDTVRFGRGASSIPVGLVLPGPDMPRLAGEISATGDHWTLTNFSAERTYVVENPDGAGEHIKVESLRCAAPVPFEIARIVVPAHRDVVSFHVYAPQQTYLEAPPGDWAGDQHTVAAFPLNQSAKYFLVLVALCEPRLRDEWPAVGTPTIEQIVTRLRPLPSCRALTATAVNFHIDYLTSTKLPVRPSANPRADRWGGKRETLISVALRFNLVRREHLTLLPPVDRRVTSV